MRKRTGDSELTLRSSHRRDLIEYRYRGGSWSVRVAATLRLPARVTAPRGLPARDAATAPPAAPGRAGGGAAQVVISYIHFVGMTKRTQSDEFIELRNLGGMAADLSGWRIEAGLPNQAFIFPSGTTLPPGERVRVYTDKETGEPGVFSFHSRRALWNDDGDVGRLLNSSQVEVSRYGYGNKETRTAPGILGVHGVADLKLVYSPQHVQEQLSARGRIDFLTALERAIRCLLEEPWLASVAALAASSFGAELAGPAGLVSRNRANLNLRSLRLLHASDLPEPERGRLQKEWLFSLEPSSGPMLRDTVAGPTLRVAVDRSGSTQARQERKG